MRFTFLVDGQPHTVELAPTGEGRYRAVVDGREITVEAVPLRDGGWRLALDSRAVIAYTASSGSARYVYANGATYTLSVPESRAGRRRSAGTGGDLTAQMPGQVVDVLAVEGETVARGQTLVVLEAMKMEIRAAAPADGRVKRVLVSKGDVVERGQPLVEFEPLE